MQSKSKTALPSINATSRAVHIDILRILSCLCVIYNHTSVRGFLRYDLWTPGAFGWLISFFSAVFCKTVPIFFMITGALLLGRDESLTKTFKRTIKILIDLVLFSVLYYWVDNLLSQTAFSLKDTLYSLLTKSYPHLWYLYAYLALIVTLPVLRKMVVAMDEKTFKYLFVITFIFLCIIPAVEYFWNSSFYSWLKPSWITAYIFIYPVTGYLIEHRVNIHKRLLRNMWILTAICFLASTICEYIALVRHMTSPRELFVQSFNFVNDATIYMTVKYLFSKKTFDRKVYGFITETGVCTFGIYLFHILFLAKIPFFLNIWNKIENFGYLGSRGGVYLSCTLVFLISGVLVWLLRKVPWVRKLL